MSDELGEQKARKYLWMRVPKLPPLDAHQQALHGQHRTVHRIGAPGLACNRRSRRLSDGLEALRFGDG